MRFITYDVHLLYKLIMNFRVTSNLLPCQVVITSHMILLRKNLEITSVALCYDLYTMFYEKVTSILFSTTI